MSFSVALISILFLFFFSLYSAELEAVNKNGVDQQTNANNEDEDEDEEEEEIVPGSTLFIKNLNFSTTEETLQEVRSEFRGRG